VIRRCNASLRGWVSPFVAKQVPQTQQDTRRSRHSRKYAIKPTHLVTPFCVSRKSRNSLSMAYTSRDSRVLASTPSCAEVSFTPQTSESRTALYEGSKGLLTPQPSLPPKPTSVRAGSSSASELPSVVLCSSPQAPHSCCAVRTYKQRGEISAPCQELRNKRQWQRTRTQPREKPVRPSSHSRHHGCVLVRTGRRSSLRVHHPRQGNHLRRRPPLRLVLPLRRRASCGTQQNTMNVTSMSTTNPSNTVRT
jgi:hypothetical protein